MTVAQWLQILSALAAFAPIPHAQAGSQLASIFLQMMADVKAKTGMTDDEIMSAAGITSIANQQAIDAELARLDALITKPLEE